MQRLLTDLYGRVQQPREQDPPPWRSLGSAFAEQWPPAGGKTYGGDDNPLRTFVDRRREGPGIWKFDHYLDMYHRHFERFRGTEAHLVEIGIYSGGSLEMWRDYLGPRCHIYGVDVEDECLRYEDDRTRVFIGDQTDRDFWGRFRAEVPSVDIVVDDGAHRPGHQITSLEELLPHMRPGGVYVVEDHHGARHGFNAYVGGLIGAMNEWRGIADHADPERRKVSEAFGFQSAIESIHSYSFATVIEKRGEPLAEFIAPKRGTEWQPFLS